MAPIKLSDGVTDLLPGMTISMAAAAIAKDSFYYDRPDEFIGDRFLRETNGDGGKTPTENDFTSTGPGNISWGKGRFTCPGRWYANDEMKLIIATILVEYDFKFPDGQMTRPVGYYRDDTLMPNQKQQIMLRKR
jgi:cytochrome P450